MAADTLSRILAAKRREVDEARARLPEDEIRRRAAAAEAPRGFRAALERTISRGRPAVIAEIKRASPSRGLIRADFDVAAIARSYATGGATCLSVLTDREFFGGSLDDLRTARAACGLPVLRKDFMIDPDQVYEARAAGADCILLIMDARPDAELASLAGVAKALGMDVLVESHDAAQLDRALAIDTSLIGINNRDLRTFETRIETTLELRSRVPPGRIVVSESGIASPEHVKRLSQAGVSAYLVGGAFMDAREPGSELERLFSEP